MPGGCAGRYFVGVNGDDAHNCSLTLSITKYSCPLNCSNRGTCQRLENGTRTCLCDKVRAAALGVRLGCSACASAVCCWSMRSVISMCECWALDPDARKVVLNSASGS